MTVTEKSGVAAQADEPFELEAVVPREQRRLLRLAARLGFSGEEGRDLVQASFADAYEKRHQLKAGAPVGPWLSAIVVRRAMSAHRRRRLAGRVLGLFRPEEVAATGPDAQLGDAQTSSKLRRHVDALPVKQRTAVALRYFEGMSVDEVAQAMGIASGTVKVHLYRALVALKAEVER